MSDAPRQPRSAPAEASLKTSVDRRTLLRGGAALGLAAPALLGAGLAAPGRAAAPMGGDPVRDVARIKLGAMEVLVMRDGQAVRENPHSMFAVNREADELAALLEKNFLPTDKVALPFSPTAVNTGAEVILFDTGLGAGAKPMGGHTSDLLAAAGIAPDAVDVVVITHMHGDHIGGLMTDGAPTYRNARYVFGQAEFDGWDSYGEGPFKAVADGFAATVKPLADKSSFIAPGETVASGIEAVNAFGHTPGHMAYHLESEGARMMITADASNHFVASLQRPDWHFLFDVDKPAAAQARKDLFGMIAADRIPFVGYHMPNSAPGFLEPLSGGGFRYVPASYQFDV